MKERQAMVELVRWQVGSRNGTGGSHLPALQAVRSCPPQFLDKTILGGKQIAKAPLLSWIAKNGSNALNDG